MDWTSRRRHAEHFHGAQAGFGWRLLRRLVFLLLGVVAADGVWGWIGPPPPGHGTGRAAEARREVPAIGGPGTRSAAGSAGALPVTPPPLADEAPALSDGEAPALSDGAAPDPPAGEVADLRRRLLLPLPGVGPGDLFDSYDDPRGRRSHQAIDILAPRNTPVLAVDEGTVARLFDSGGGGLTIYQFDAAAEWVYYYAHLEGYRRGLAEGDRVRRGEVIGYVGTSGNAPEDVPHLHFAIHRLGAEKRWWRGEPVNPFLVFGPAVVPDGVRAGDAREAR